MRALIIKRERDMEKNNDFKSRTSHGKKQAFDLPYFSLFWFPHKCSMRCPFNLLLWTRWLWNVYFYYFLINLYSRSHEPLIKMEVGSPWPKKKEWKGQNESKGRNLFVTYDSITTISKLSRKMNLILHWYKYVSRMIKVGFMFFLGSNSCFIKLEDKPQRHPWV